jgi:3-hydroxyacyl-[acyl-carrier-protein] dehydratase
MAQASCVLACETINVRPGGDGDDHLYLFAGIDNVRFKHMVVPGDQLRLEVQQERHRQGIWKFNNRALVDGKVVCSADMTCARVPKS